jgi:hypothetical protein
LFDRQLWAAQLLPLIRLWEQLLSTAPPSLRQLLAAPSSSTVGGAAAPVAANPSEADSVAAFVALERAFGAALLRVVAATMGSIQAAVAGEGLLVPAAVQVRVLQRGLT